MQADHLTLELNPNYTGEQAGARERHLQVHLRSDGGDLAPCSPATSMCSRASRRPKLLEQFKSNPELPGDRRHHAGRDHPRLQQRPARRSTTSRCARPIAHAIDRQAIIDGAQFGYGTPIGSFFPPGDPAYVDLTGVSNFDPEKSKALLAEAGVTDLTLTFKVPPAAYARSAAPIIQQQLANVGITVNITNVEWADWIANVFQGAYDYDLTMVSHVEANDFAAFGKPGYYINYKADALNALVAELEQRRPTRPSRSRSSRTSRSSSPTISRSASSSSSPTSRSPTRTSRACGSMHRSPSPTSPGSAGPSDLLVFLPCASVGRYRQSR